MNYIKEQLRNQKKLNFDAARQNVRHAPQVEILTDTLYIQVFFTFSSQTYKPQVQVILNYIIKFIFYPYSQEFK